MKFLPYEKFTIQTNKSAAVVKYLMESNVEPKVFVSTVWGPTISKDFYGFVREDDFDISPVTSIPNAFIPTIKGKIKDKQVDIIMTPNILVIAFMAMFIANCVIFLVLSLMAGGITVSDAIPIIMVVFAYCLMYFTFWYGAIKSKKMLMDLIGVMY